MNAKHHIPGPLYGARIKAMEPRNNQQSGIALVVALVLLIAVTLVGLAAIRGTTLQQKMTSNFYDRELEFQAAEAALRTAAAEISLNANVIARNCGSGGVTCETNPFTDPNFDTSKIQTVQTSAFNASAAGTGQPQYVVENMGAFADPSSSTGFGQTANSAQYGAQGASTTSIFYRITARSADPTTVGDRSVVVLQATVKQ